MYTLGNGITPLTLVKSAKHRINEDTCLKRLLYARASEMYHETWEN